MSRSMNATMADVDIELPNPVLRRLMVSATHEAFGRSVVYPEQVIMFARSPLGTSVELAYHKHEIKQAFKRILRALAVK